MLHKNHNRSYLIAGLDCGTGSLDCWTGLLDWPLLKLCVPHDLHPIRCAELGHLFNALWLIDCCETKDTACINLWEFYAQETLKGRPILQHWHCSLFQGLSLTKHSFYMATFNKTMGNSLITTNQHGIWHQDSPWYSKFVVKRPLSVRLMLFAYLL